MQGETSGLSRAELQEFRRFQQFLRRDAGQSSTSPRRYRHRRAEGDDDEEDEEEGRGQSGPAPSWDASSPFEDYLIKAKLWLATTKAKPKSRGPLLLKALGGSAFENFKFLAKDSSWLNNPRGAEHLLDEMNRPEYYGEDRQEHMLTAMSRLTYHMKRTKGESWREFFARWDTALRKVHEHKISLPEEYEGFLMINGLQLAEGEVKALLNYTHGCIKPTSIKDWLRKNETRLSAQELGADKKKTTASIMLTENYKETEEHDEEGENEYDEEIHELESYLMDVNETENVDPEEILEENEAQEILATILQKKKNYQQSMKLKKEKFLSRGYGKGAGYGGSGKGKGYSAPFRTGNYNISGQWNIREIQKRTRCHNCGELGHFKKQCPQPPKQASGNGNVKTHENHHLEPTSETDEVYFVGHLEQHQMTQFLEDSERSTSSRVAAPVVSRECYKERLEPSGEGLHAGELYFFPTWFCGMMDKPELVHDHTCATVDTGCQRLAIGKQTLQNFHLQLPSNLKITLHPEVNRFKSVHQTSTTTRVASIPCSLGVRGSLLRPAVFEDEHSQHAPFLLSLTFLIHCHGELVLSPEKGLRIRIRGEKDEIPLHLGPTGALRIPLQRFNGQKLRNLEQRQAERLERERGEFEVLSLDMKSQPQVETNKREHRPNEPNPRTSSQLDASYGAGSQCREEIPRRRVSPGAGQPLGGHGAPYDQLVHPEGSTSVSGKLAGPRDWHAGGEDGRRYQDGGAHLHPRPLGHGDPKSRDGKRFGSRVQPGDSNFSNPNTGDSKVKSTWGQAADATVTNTIKNFGGMERGIDGSWRPDLRGGRSGGDLWSDSTLQLPTGSTTTSLPEAGRQLQPDFLPVPSEDRPSMSILSMDHCPTISTAGTMARARDGMVKSGDFQGDADGHGAAYVPTPNCDQGRHQRLLREGDLQDLQETAEEQSQDRRHIDTKDGDGGRLQGVPTVSEMEAGEQQEGLELPELQPLPPRMERKIRAALKKAVAFWKQIQGILISCGNEDVPMAGLLQKFNHEICQELNENPNGSKRSHELAEIMGLTHQQLRTVAEVYNPGCFQKMTLKHQLTPGKVFGVTLGHDLTTKEKKDEVRKYLRTMRPGLVLIAPPCKMYSQLQNLSKNLREVDQEVMKNYLKNRKEAQGHLQFAVELCELCIELGLKFVFEHPFTATSWSEPAMKRLLQRAEVLFTRGDQCQFGLRGPDGGLHRKATGFVTNSKRMSQMLNRRCDGREHTHEVIIGGKKSQLAQQYPEELIKTIIKTYKEMINRSEINYITYQEMDAENYQIDKLLRSTNTANPIAEEGLEDKECLHAGADEGEGPAAGGHPEGDDSEIPQGDEPGLPEEDGAEAERGGHQELPLADRFTLKRIIQRAHEGLGHPATDRFIRILRYAKAKPEVIAEARNFKCSVCQRHQVTRPARRSAPPRELDVNDCVGVDVIYLPIPGNKTMPTLNMIDWGSKFQLRKPSETRNAYRQWLRIFGAPKRLAIDMGKEFRSDFLRQAEQDGTYVDPAAVEAPHQRGITERHGKTFKFMLMKAMDTFNCESMEEWRELVDITTMTKNRMMYHNGFSPIQRVIGFAPKIPGGLLNGDDRPREVPSNEGPIELAVTRSMRMRKAAATAFIEADASATLRRAITSGPRPMQDYDIGEMVYFYRMGADKQKKFSPGYWQGPARIVMIDQPSTLWLSFQGYLVKAAPERVRRASEEESLSMSSWLEGLVKRKNDPCTDPKNGYLDLTDHDLPPKAHHGALGDDAEMEQGDYTPTSDEEDKLLELPPMKRYRFKAPEVNPTAYPVPPRRPGDRQEDSFEDLERDYGRDKERDHTGTSTRQDDQAEVKENDQDLNLDAKEGGEKRELENSQEEMPTKKSRLEHLEIYYTKVVDLLKTKVKKEIKLNELSAINRKVFNKAIQKEIKNNVDIGAYRPISMEESARVRRETPEKVMESRFVLTTKPLEPHEVPLAEMDGLKLDWEADEPCKAKARHVMKGFSEDGAEDREASTPQVTREGTLLVAQLITSHRWRMGFLDFTQAFHSGDAITRTIYATQPREGVPGMKPGQLIKLEKVCYGLVDGPYAWYQHLRKFITTELGYQQSLADPCIFYACRNKNGHAQLGGIIAVATDDLLHGGDEEHLQNMEKIKAKYKLGKFQFDQGRFTGKNFETQEDGSVTVHQEHYTKEKLFEIEFTKARKRQRFSFCTDAEISLLRTSVGALAWLAKESRPDIAGRVALLQQVFPRPRVKDMLEANSIVQEARKEARSGIRLMPIPPQFLRIGVVTDASWANAKDHRQLEVSANDEWEEQDGYWIRHHRTARRTLFHPGASEGPDLHSLMTTRRTVKGNGETLEDNWTKGDSIREWDGSAWIGKTYFPKLPDGEVLEPQEINETFLKLMNCSSQGGYIMMFYDKRLETEDRPHMVSITAWRSTRLKRKTVNTLSAECQALIAGIGQVHWHRFLLLEVTGSNMTDQDWEHRLAAIPYVAVVDSKSLYDCMNRLVCTYAQVEDKRTAIDVAILKDDLQKTGGHLRWIEGDNMIADSLTKKMNNSFLRSICNSGKWTLSKAGHHKLCQEHDVLMIAIHKPHKVVAV